MTGISFYCFLWRLISVRRVRASNGRQNRFFYRSHRNGQSRKNIVFMRLCGVSGIHFLRRGEQIILLFFILCKSGPVNDVANVLFGAGNYVFYCVAASVSDDLYKGIFVRPDEEIISQGIRLLVLFILVSLFINYRICILASMVLYTWIRLLEGSLYIFPAKFTSSTTDGPRIFLSHNTWGLLASFWKHLSIRSYVLGKRSRSFAQAYVVPALISSTVLGSCSCLDIFLQ